MTIHNNEQKRDFKQKGERENHSLIIRVTKTQKTRLKMLAEASGFKTISDYVRINLLNPSIEEKLNSIIRMLQNSK